MYDKIKLKLLRIIGESKMLISVVDERVKKYQEIINSLPMYGLNNILNCKHSSFDLTISILSILIKDMSYDELRKIVKENSYLIYNSSMRIREAIVSCCDLIYGTKRDFENFCLTDEEQKIIASFFPNNINVESFIKLCNLDLNACDTIIMMNDFERIKNQALAIKNNPLLPESKKKQLLSRMEHTPEFKNLNNTIQRTKEYAEGLITNLKKLKKDNSLVINTYEQLLNDLDKNINSKELFCQIYDNFYIEDVSLRDQFYKTFMKNKKEELKRLKKRKEKLSVNNEAVIITLLKNAGIEINEQPTTRRMHLLNMDIEELKIRLELLDLLKININDSIVVLPIEYVSDLIENINNQIILPIFIKSHLELLTSVKYANYMRTRDLMKRYVNITNFSECAYVYLYDYDIVKKNIRLLENYGTIDNIKNVDNYEFLNNSDLANKIDLLLELGYKTILSEHLELLNFSFDSLMKLCIISELGDTFDDYDGIVNYLNKNNKLLLDSKINDYLFDNNSIIPDDISKLLEADEEETQEKYDVFMIDSIIVSEHRYLTNYNKLSNSGLLESYKSFFAIVYNAHYSYEKIEKIAIHFGYDLIKYKRAK